MQIGRVNLVHTVKQTAREVLADDVTGLAAELAFRFFLALFPFVIFLAALGGMIAGLADIANPADRAVKLLGDQVPDDAASIVQRQLEGIVGGRSPSLLSFGIVGAIWAASGGVRAMMKAMNRAYDVEETRAFWSKYALSIGVTVLAGGFIPLAVTLLVAGEQAVAWVAESVGMSGVWSTVLYFGRWPAAIITVMGILAFVYWAVPNIALPFKWITPGAVLCTLVWVLATLLFGLYVSHIGRFNATYGALGGVAVLLLWFYLTGMILLVGAELNAVVDEQVDRDLLEAKRREKQGRVAAEHSQPQFVPAQPQEAPQAPDVRTRVPDYGRSAAAAVGCSVVAFVVGWTLGRRTDAR